jgi:Peptidyl-prolyl cis-trans isomerase (rotamase) - cyclophilin family
MSIIPILIFLQSMFAYPVNQKNIEVAQIITPLGEILIMLDERTPRHRESFIELAEAGYWDSLTFNRVIPDFVAQGGCPDTPEGFNDPEYLLEPEFDPSLTHVYGAVGAGRDNNPDKLSARCQFYIVENKEGLHRLDGDYTVFGRVIQGMDIVEKIVRVSRDENDQPLEDITLDVNIIEIPPRQLRKILDTQ